MVTTPEIVRLASIGRVYVSELERFVKFVDAISAARDEFPSLKPLSESTGGLFHGDTWEFEFVGRTHSLQYRSRHDLGLNDGGITLTTEDNVGVTALVDPDGNVTNLSVAGLKLPGDAVAMFALLLGNLFHAG